MRVILAITAFVFLTSDIGCAEGKNRPSAVDQAKKSLQTGILNQLTKLADSGEKISCRDAESRLQSIVAQEVLKIKDVLKNVPSKEADNIVKYVLQTDRIKEAIKKVLDMKEISQRKLRGKKKPKSDEWKNLPKDIRGISKILIEAIAKELVIVTGKLILSCVLGEADDYYDE